MKVTGLIPIRACAWVVGQVPSWGVGQAVDQCDVSLPLFLPPSPLSKNKYIKSKNIKLKKKAMRKVSHVFKKIENKRENL